MSTSSTCFFFFAHVFRLEGVVLCEGGSLVCGKIASICLKYTKTVQQVGAILLNIKIHTKFSQCIQRSHLLLVLQQSSSYMNRALVPFTLFTMQQLHKCQCNQVYAMPVHRCRLLCDKHTDILATLYDYQPQAKAQYTSTVSLHVSRICVMMLNL